MQRIKEFFINIWSDVSDFVRRLFGKKPVGRSSRYTYEAPGLDQDDNGGGTRIFNDDDSKQIKELARTSPGAS